MKALKLGKSNMMSSRLVYGCMRIVGDNSKEDELRIKSEFDFQASKYNFENWIIMLAWLLKHPAMVLPIVGTTTPSRIKAAKQALEIDYSREDWYRLLEARNSKRVP